jgi:hypothetical protein
LRPRDFLAAFCAGSAVKADSEYRDGVQKNHSGDADRAAFGGIMRTKPQLKMLNTPIG